ncbi:fructose-bisphosphate aldolase-lysine N-methyltransferase, chloroplastic [Ananas comosus]|uniref:Fructose-bisphosphate aldolase-lysine N-methyltransferase, chloroplastic n=2 Tax=Ananas comosus TaxID=4615 RepID=A0A6P5GTX1_ANACO|nr:fructose-bisphosphate aldolase-lysine N-methyltransferase, chloroplastic [Ananas comosus]
MLSVIHVTNGHALKIHRSSRTHFPAGVATMALHHLLLTPPHPFSFSPPLLPLLTPFSSSTHRSISLLTTTNPRPKLYSTALRPTHALLQTLDSGSVPSESALGDFSQWLRKNGAVGSSPPPVKPSFVPEGLGLVAQRDLPRNEVVVEVPKKLWIDADTVAASAIGRVCGGLKPWVAISLFLLREKAMGDASPWRPYLDILPRQTDSTIFWSEEELLEIQGTQLLSTTIGVKEYVKSEFDQVEDAIIVRYKDLFPSTITFLDFLWAFGILRSRAFPRLRGENLALIPLADLINHSDAITSGDPSWEIKGKGLFSRELIFSLRTPVPVKSGEQVYIQFDLSKSNAELALDYGFIESRSDRQAYTLTLEISESDPFYGDKLDIAESNGLGETAYFDIVLGGSLPPQMLPYLRLVALGGTDAFLLESIFRNSVWGHLELPVSRANEETICRVVRYACKSALSSYRTTIQEDEELINGGNLDRRLRIAVGVRAGEKKVLNQIEDIFRERELELDGLEYYQERRLKDLGLTGEQGEIIFWESR